MGPEDLEPPDEPRAGHDPGDGDELAARRLRRFARHADPPRYGCPTCGAHAEHPGLCLVCCADVTQRIDEHGHLLPPT